MMQLTQGRSHQSGRLPQHVGTIAAGACCWLPQPLQAMGTVNPVPHAANGSVRTSIKHVSGCCSPAPTDSCLGLLLNATAAGRVICWPAQMQASLYDVLARETVLAQDGSKSRRAGDSNCREKLAGCQAYLWSSNSSGTSARTKEHHSDDSVHKSSVTRHRHEAREQQTDVDCSLPLL